MRLMRCPYDDGNDEVSICPCDDEVSILSRIRMQRRCTMFGMLDLPGSVFCCLMGRLQRLTPHVACSKGAG